MQVRHLQLENFRAFRNADMNFPEAGLVLVAGPNNAGKTALLSALDVLAGDQGDLTSLRHGHAQTPARLSATFNLHERERAAILQNAVGGQWLLDAGVLSSLQFVFEQREDQSLVLREVLGKWPDSEELQPVATMRIQPNREQHPYGYQVISAFQQDNDRQPGQVQVLASPAQDHRLLEPPRHFTDGKGGLDAFLSSGNLAPLMALMTEWRSRFYHFRALRTGTQRSQSTTSPEKLDPTGDNLAGVLHYLVTDRPHLFDQVSNLIAQLVSGIGTLRVRTGGNNMRVVFESGAGDLNLKDLGTGVEQLLMTITVGLTQQSPFTLLIEEPETNLNPNAQRALLRLLQGWAADRLIIAATHSAVMLDWSPAGDRLWLVTREQDVSLVEPVRADPLPLMEALGVRLSDVLSADRVLVVEGSSDEDILQVWFPEVLRHPRVAVLCGRGGDNARHADQFAAWLADTDRAGMRRVLYLRDHDELAPKILQRLTQSQSVHVLQRREIENYLLDPAAIATVIAPLVRVGASAPGTADVATALSAAAENLRQKIVINRVAQQVAPPRMLMDNSLRERLAEDGVDVDEFTKAVTERLMTPAQLTAQITDAWIEAESDVSNHTGDGLLEIAPGEEILKALFDQYTGRRYKKRVHGPAIAAAMSPPAELTRLFNAFMTE